MKMLFLILFPIISSCNPQWCSYDCPHGCPKTWDAPMKTVQTGKPKMANDWSEEETEGQPIIDWPFEKSVC